jgi:hypothetical protein
MIARDAAHLLVAVLGSHHVKDSVQSVRGYRETRLSGYLSTGYHESSIAALTSLPPDHSFVDAVEALVAAAADGSLGRAMYEAIGEIQGEKVGFPPIIKISVQSPQQVGDISIGGGEVGIARPGLYGYGRYALLDPWSQHESLDIPVEELEAWQEGRRILYRHRSDPGEASHRQDNFRARRAVTDLMFTNPNLMTRITLPSTLEIFHVREELSHQ